MSIAKDVFNCRTCFSGFFFCISTQQTRMVVQSAASNLQCRHSTQLLIRQPSLCTSATLAVILVLPRAPPPAALPADTGRAALPLQTLPQHRQHGRRGWTALDGHTAAISESQVYGDICVWSFCRTILSFE